MIKKAICGVLIGLCGLFLSGCGGNNVVEIAKNSISELTLNYFVGETENFKVSMSSGLREQDYAVDGVRGDLVEFCVLSVVPVGGVDTFGLEYTVEINEDTHQGVFEQSPFDHSLASDLGLSVADSDEVFVYIILNNETEIAKLNCISSDFEIKETLAVNIAVEHLLPKISALLEDKKSIEGYCKVISSDKNLGIYFWYVSFVNTDFTRIAVIIDPASGEIIAEL